MKKLYATLTATLASLMIAGIAHADVKFGVIDMNKVLSQSPLMVSLNEKLAKNFKPRQEELNAAKKQLQQEVDQLNLTNSTINADERTKLQNKIINDKANVDILQASFDRDLALAKNKDLQNFMTKLGAAIGKVAQDGNYDIIEQRSNLTFVHNRLDVTQQVLDQLK